MKSTLPRAPRSRRRVRSHQPPAKRALDILVSLPGLLLAVPLLLPVALLVRLDSPGNPLFRQRRVGLGGRPFTIYKLRTLHLRHFGVYLEGEITPHDYRVTRLGRYLRRSKIDELPQLLNVLLGHMSLVGPQPDIAEAVATYQAGQHQRLRARPGLTGVAQISGNIHLSWAERIGLDCWYIRHWSLWLDLRVLLRTPAAIWRGEAAGFDPLRLRPARP